MLALRSEVSNGSRYSLDKGGDAGQTWTWVTQRYEKTIQLVRITVMSDLTEDGDIHRRNFLHRDSKDEVSVKYRQRDKTRAGVSLLTIKAYK